MMCRKIIFIFILFLVVVGIENVSFSSEDGVLYSRTVVKNGTEQDTSEYDIEYEDDEESEDDSYYNDSNKKYVSDAKSGDRKGGKKTEKKKITKKKVNKKTINNNRTLFKMFDVSFSIGLGGLLLQKTESLASDMKRKFGITAFLGFRLLYNLQSFDGKMKLFFTPEFVYEYSKLSFNTKETVEYYGKYYNNNYVLLNDNKTFGENILSNNLLNLTKYNEENIKIEKTQDAYVNELELRNRTLIDNNSILLNEIGKKNGDTVSVSENEGSFYDRIRYIDKKSETNKNLLENYTETDFAETDIGKAYAELQKEKTDKDRRLNFELIIDGIKKKVSEWLQENEDNDDYQDWDRHLLIAFLRIRDCDKKIEEKENELSNLLDGIKNETEALNSLKGHILTNISKNEEDIKTNENKIKENSNDIKDALKAPVYTEYLSKSYYFSSNIISMFSYSTKIGLEIYRVSPYIKIAFGGMATGNTITSKSTGYKEVLINAETGKYNLYYTSSEQTTASKKKISLMYGIGFGASLKVTDNFSLFAEYVYKTSKYDISFQENIEKTFTYNIHSVSFGINVFF